MKSAVISIGLNNLPKEPILPFQSQVFIFNILFRETFPFMIVGLYYLCMCGYCTEMD